NIDPSNRPAFQRRRRHNRPDQENVSACVKQNLSVLTASRELGRIGHALKAGRLEGESRIGGFFRALTSAERRTVPLHAAQEHTRAEMGHKALHQASKAAVDALRADYRPIYQTTYGEYKETRSQLLVRQQGEREQLKAMWAARHDDKRQVWQQLGGDQHTPSRAATAIPVGRVEEGRSDRQSAAQSERSENRTDQQERPTRTSREMKPPSRGTSSSPALPDSALAALWRASATIDQEQQ
ncbi:MAG: hypothetical protein ACR2QH_05345, partial [Geminicoccaceae bacterium]